MIVTPLGQRIVVRFRKALWMPTAPSKLFRIDEHKFYSPEEIKQIALIYKTYKSQERSIQEFMKHEFYVPATKSGGLPQEFVDQELLNDRRIFEENERENARIAKIREETLARNLKKLEEQILEYKLTKEEELIDAAQIADNFVAENIDNSECFVTPENIDILIEKAMENPKSYEYCIDRNGKKRY